MNKFVFLILDIIFAVQCVYAKPVLPDQHKYLPDSAKEIEKTILYEQNYNAIYFNALCLDNTQTAEFEEISLKYGKIYKEYTDRLIKASEKYKTMKDNNLPIKDKRAQKREIKRIYKMLKKNLKEEISALKNILTKEQRSKYKLLKHLEVHDIKKNFHSKNYYKTNPKMSKFGDLDK